MFNLKKTQIINAPRKEVFPFFASPENLEKITPPDLGFIIKTPKPLEMKEGGIFDYTIKLGIIRFPWKTLITKYDPPHIFQDTQKFGPYKKWEHTHQFFDLGDKTKIVDTVDYDLYPRFLSKVINKLFIRNKVEKIFEYRSLQLDEIFIRQNQK